MSGCGPFEDTCRNGLIFGNDQFTQATISVDERNPASFENFFTDNNQPALTLLREFIADDTLNTSCYLWGKRGTGKTHLLYAACRCVSPSFYIPILDLHVQPEDITRLESNRLICVDDIQSITGQPSWEKRLLVLLDNLETTGNLLLLAGDRAPVDLDFDLKDIVNRLKGRQVLRLSPSADETKIKILIDRATERGLSIDASVVQFILNHYSRDMHSLLRLLDRIALSSLKYHRRVTIPFLREMDEFHD